MSLGDRLREMLDPGSTAGGARSGYSSGSTSTATPPRRRARSQAQPVNPTTRSYDTGEPARPLARAQWIGLGLAAALAVALTAGLVFLILTIMRPGDAARPNPTPVAAAASPTAPPPISAIFGTFTPTPITGPTATPQVVGLRLQVAGTGGDGANMRRDPGADALKVKTVPENAPVEVIGPDRSIDGTVWRNVRDTAGDTGWIVGSFLVPEGSGPVAAQPGTSLTPGSTSAGTNATPRPTTAPVSAARGAGQVGNTGGQGANIRSEPGTAGPVLKTLAEGTNIEVLGPEREVEGRVWRQVRDSSGVTGWIVAGAVVAPGTLPTPTGPGQRPAGTPGPTSAPAAKPTSGSSNSGNQPANTGPSGGAPLAPTNTPAPTPQGGLPIIIQPATPRAGSSPAPKR